MVDHASGHDSSISVVYPSGPGAPPTAHISIRLPSLPLVSLSFTSESQIIAAGHDCQPVVFTGSSDGWAYSHSLDDPTSASRALTPSSTGARVPSGGGVGRLNNEAFNRFKAADSRGHTKTPSTGNAPTSAGMTPVGADGLLLTVHQNSITWVEPYEWSASGEVSKLSTAGKDGKLVIWPVTGKSAGGASLANRMGGLPM